MSMVLSISKVTVTVTSVESSSITVMADETNDIVAGFD